MIEFTDRILKKLPSRKKEFQEPVRLFFSSFWMSDQIEQSSKQSAAQGQNPDPADPRTDPRTTPEYLGDLAAKARVS